MCRQLKHHQLRIRSEIFISLEIILNAFNVWQYHFPLKSLFWLYYHLFISVSILREFAMLSDRYILLSPQEEEMHNISINVSKQSFPNYVLKISGYIFWARLLWVKIIKNY